MAITTTERRPAPTAARAVGPRPDFPAIVRAGLWAGFVYLALQMILDQLFTTRGGWEPLKAIAAIVLGRGVLSPTPITGAAVIVGVLLNFALSVFYAWLVTRLVLQPRSRGGGEVVIGAVAGWVLYFVNYYLFTRAFPWFSVDRNGITLFDHWVWGAVVAALYVNRAGARWNPQSV